MPVSRRSLLGSSGTAALLLSHSGAQAQMLQSIVNAKTSGSAPLLTFTALANGSPGGSPLAGSGTYTGTAPTSITTATWTGGGGGSSTVASFVASGGTWSATFTPPASTGTCALAITDNRSATATSPSVTISSGYTGPIDIQPSPTAWYGLRAGSAAIAATGTQKAVNVIRASDSTTMDILILTTGALDLATLATFLTATTGKVVTWYDQSGNGHHLTSPASVNRPAIIATGKGAVVFDGTTSVMNAALAAVSLPISYSGVINPTGAGDTSDAIFFAHVHQVDTLWNGHYIDWKSTTHVSGAWSVAANSFSGSTTTATLATGSNGVVGGVFASSTSRTAYLNGTAATVDTTSEAPTTQDTIFMGSGFGGGGGFVASNFLNGKIFEMGYWPANASANMAALSTDGLAYGY